MPGPLFSRAVNSLDAAYNSVLVRFGPFWLETENFCNYRLVPDRLVIL